MIFSQKSPEIRNIIMKELPKCVVVIGAGPSGLVAVKTLKEHGVKSVICLEMSHELGGTFVNKTCEEKKINTFSTEDELADIKSTSCVVDTQLLCVLPAVCIAVAHAPPS